MKWKTLNEQWTHHVKTSWPAHSSQYETATVKRPIGHSGAVAEEFLHFSQKHLWKSLQNIWQTRRWQSWHKQEVGPDSTRLSIMISIAHWLDKTSLYLCVMYSAWCTCRKLLNYFNYYFTSYSFAAEICPNDLYYFSIAHNVLQKPGFASLLSEEEICNIIDGWLHFAVLYTLRWCFNSHFLISFSSYWNEGKGWLWKTSKTTHECFDNDMCYCYTVPAFKTKG